MSVKELFDWLKDLPDDMEVRIVHDNGHPLDAVSISHAYAILNSAQCHYDVAIICVN